jgi:zinc protease
MDNYEIYTLDNGLKVALEKKPTETINGTLRVFHGALHEKKGEEGLAHFLEHTLIMGGSEKYDTKETENIWNSFGFSNAYTSLDETTFPVDIINNDLELYLDFISNAVFKPKFDNQKVEQEKYIVLRESSDNKSKPDYVDNKKFIKALYGKNSPLDYSILGKDEVVESTTRNELQKFHSRGYHPNNMDFVLVGGLPKNIKKLVEKYFGDYKPGPGKKFEFPKNSPLTKKSKNHSYAPELINKDHPEASSATLSMAFFAPTKKEKDEYSIEILNEILGGSELKENLQDEKIIERIKKRKVYNCLKLLGTNEGRSKIIHFVIDDDLTTEKYLTKINEITPENIREAAIKYLPDKNGNYVLLLRDPLKNKY